jgi:transcriptional regulator with XRE-family HTH domain
MSLKVQYLLRQNIDALLKARGQKRKDLALYCHRTESWLSQIFGQGDRNIPLKYLDRMAGFFGLEPYQLFQPGISPLTERRTGLDRRSGVDRRVSHVAEMRLPVPSQIELETRMRQLSPEAYRRFARRVEAALVLGAQGRDDTDPHDRPETVEPSRARGSRTPRPR